MSSSIILGATAIVALAALGWVIWGAAGLLGRKIDQIQPLNTPAPPVDLAPYDSALRDLSELYKENEDIRQRVRDLTKAVAEGIDHVDRNEKRVRGIVTGAKRRFAAEGFVDPGVNAEADSLPRDDATGFADEGVPPVSNDVVPENLFAGVPGTVPLGFTGE